MSRLEIKTFSDIKHSSIKVANQNICIDSEVLFRRLFLVSKDRGIELATVMKYELSPPPPSLLYYDDGSIRKTSKEELAKKTEANTEKIEQLPTLEEGCAADVTGGMFIIQSMNERLFMAYAQLAESFVRRVVKFFSHTMQSVCVLFDRYESKFSIKQSE